MQYKVVFEEADILRYITETTEAVMGFTVLDAHTEHIPNLNPDGNDYIFQIVVTTTGEKASANKKACFSL